MNTFWRNHRGAIITFATVCVATLGFPALVNMRTGYYLNHGVVIPVWGRALMGTATLVKGFRLPVILIAGVVVWLVSLTASQRVKQQ